MVGKCCLCLEQRELQRSHLLPKALYRLIGSGTNPDHPDTVQLSSRGIKKSSEQVWRHLLCVECEDRLNKNGEKWVLHNCYRGRGIFRLRAELMTRPNLSPGAKIEIYSAAAEEMTKLAYFCTSVVWRASLCDWVCRGEKYERIDLGPYQEKIRKYIRGEASVPDRVALEIELSGLPHPKLAMNLPLTSRAESSHCYSFHIPGMTFAVMVGGPDWQHSILEPPNPIFVGKHGDRIAQDGMTHLMGRTPPRGYELPLVDGTERIS